MAIHHVRARHTAHGGIAAVSERALELGHLPGWERADGPLPKRPKSRRPKAETAKIADVVSAESDKE